MSSSATQRTQGDGVCKYWRFVSLFRRLCAMPSPLPCCRSSYVKCRGIILSKRKRKPTTTFLLKQQSWNRNYLEIFLSFSATHVDTQLVYSLGLFPAIVWCRTNEIVKAQLKIIDFCLIADLWRKKDNRGVKAEPGIGARFVPVGANNSPRVLAPPLCCRAPCQRV